MIEQFINFVIRPPRAEYNPDQYLWEKNFTLAGRTYKREDLELKNTRGHTLLCSHYLPSPFPEDTPLPCVIYCHGNSGCRADANEAAVILLPSYITLFTLDFSGSGLSDGDYVSLGWHERDDLKVVVSYLRSNKQISRIGLWGRSMGAVTSLLYGAEDPSIAGMVLDSAFSNLYDLMMELVDVYKIRLPKFTVKMAVQYMRRVIERKAKFDIMNLNCLQVAPKTYIPALFGHASDDKFIQPHHSDLIFKSYAGDKNIIKFDGDHNSSRPQFYYDSVSIFFYNVLHPPQISAAQSSKLEKYYDLGDLKTTAGMNESLLYEIITGLHSAGSHAGSSSSAPRSTSASKSVGELLSEIAPVTTVDSMLNENNSLSNLENLQDKPNGQNEECCSYTSSNRESWGRCSSLGGSDEESSADCTAVDNSHQVSLSLSLSLSLSCVWRYAFASTNFDFSKTLLIAIQLVPGIGNNLTLIFLLFFVQCFFYLSKIGNNLDYRCNCIQTWLSYGSGYSCCGSLLPYCYILFSNSSHIIRAMTKSPLNSSHINKGNDKVTTE